MKTILLFLICFSTSTLACDFTRDQVLDCIQKHVDVNQDGAVTRNEIHYIVDTYGTYAQKIYFNLLNGMTRIFSDCDYDGNGVLTVRDFMMTTGTCFATREQQCNMQKICLQIQGGK